MHTLLHNPVPATRTRYCFNHRPWQEFPIQSDPEHIAATGPCINQRGFIRDLSAAFVGALASLPQAVAYGLIAVSALGPGYAVFGITASVGSAIAFCLLTGAFDSNRFLISGPRAVTALVISSAIGEGLARGIGPEAAIIVAFSGVICAGLLQVLAGVLRLGSFVSYVPVPVLAGFINASALLVFLSSLPMVLGLPDYDLTALLAGGMADSSLWALTVGGVTVVGIFLLEGRSRIVPPALLALLAGTLTYFAGTRILGLDTAPLVGNINLLALLDSPLADLANEGGPLLSNLDIVIASGVSIGMLATFDTVLAGSAIALQTHQANDPNHDLKVHGLGNILMGVAGYLPGSGALSRSSALISAGALTRMATVGSGLVFFLLLYFLAPVVAALPLWSTSGMLLATALQAFDKGTLAKMWGLAARHFAFPLIVAGDLLVTIAVVIAAVAYGLITAVGLGLVLAIMLFVLGMSRNPIRRSYTGQAVRSKVQRPVQDLELLENLGHRIVIVELQGALFFGACAQLFTHVSGLIRAGACHVVLDCRHLSSIDSTGSSTFYRLHLLCREHAGQLLVSNVEPERRRSGQQLPAEFCEQRRRRFQPRRIWLNLQVNGVLQAIGQRWFLGDVETALSLCENLLLNGVRESSRNRTALRLTASPILRGLSRRQQKILAVHVTKRRFASGETVFTQGEDAARAYLLVYGQMETLLSIPGSSRQRLVNVLVNGALFGEMGLLDGEPRSATVLAKQQSLCICIDAAALQCIQTLHPEIAMLLLKNISRQFAMRLRHANNMIAQLEQ
jgi:SulP family sulfate permease